MCCDYIIHTHTQPHTYKHMHVQQTHTLNSIGIDVCIKIQKEMKIEKDEHLMLEYPESCTYNLSFLPNIQD